MPYYPQVMYVAQAAAPTPTQAGMQWFDTTNKLLKLRDSTNAAWQTITPVSALVATSETTASTTYTDLATSGPAVTILTGTSALVTLGGDISNAATGGFVLASVAVSGATTVAAADTVVLGTSSAVNGAPRMTASRTFPLTGLTAGSNVFTMKYRVTASTGTYAARWITVQAIPT